MRVGSAGKTSARKAKSFQVAMSGWCRWLSHKVALARWEEMPRNNEKLLVRAMLGNTNGGMADRYR